MRRYKHNPFSTTHPLWHFHKRRQEHAGGDDDVTEVGASLMTPDAQIFDVVPRDTHRQRQRKRLTFVAFQLRSAVRTE